MTDPSPFDYLEDIRREAMSAIEFLGTMSLEELQADTRTAYAIFHSLERIGEATKNLPPSIRTQFPDVPWKGMAGIRDRLIHGYRTIDLDIVWTTVTVRLPSLPDQISRVIDELQRGSDPA
jgi:uncharacterized protein with HEPN domain